jgi:hypothetical protein
MTLVKRNFAIFALGAVLLTNSAAAQDTDSMSRWGQTTGDALVHFLPNASRWGMTVDPYPLFSAFANETYDYKGANSMVRKYPSYVVHQTWWFDDAGLSRQMADLEKEKAALKQETEKAGEEFFRVHGAELKAFEKAHLKEMETLSSQVAGLTQQGKSEEAQAVLKKIEELPAVYPPYQALTASLDKRQQELTDRERTLTTRRRQVSFRIYTNRTPLTTAPKYAPKPVGTLAGHPFYRQDEGNMKAGDWDTSLVDLAVYVGPPGWENPRVKIGHKELAVKCIVVWAWIESHPDTVKADEAAVRKVLGSMDYDGLAKLIEP